MDYNCQFWDDPEKDTKPWAGETLNRRLICFSCWGSCILKYRLLRIKLWRNIMERFLKGRLLIPGNNSIEA